MDVNSFLFIRLGECLQPLVNKHKVHARCSATCGEGTQRLLVVCRRLGLNGQYQTLIPEACASVPKPSTARSCSCGSCEKTFKPVAVKPDPAILTQRKIYIQWRKGPKLHFVVGGYAYLLPWTSIMLSCPTRHFHKGNIRWLKDGKPLLLLPHVSISHMGYIKIQQIRASDAGMYTCVAGQAQENFVLKLLGNKKTKVSVPESDVWATDGGKNSAKTYQISSKEKEILNCNRYDIVVQHLLNLKGLSLETYVSKELLDEDAVFDSQTPQLLVADMEKLDEITRNLSGGLQGTQKEELITQLLDELTKKTGENNDSTLEAHEKQEFTTPEYISQGNDLRLASQSTRQWKGPLRRPVIVQKFSRVYKSPHEIVTNAGSFVVVPRQAVRVELKCEVQGNPKPVMVWTKEGMELKNGSRVGLMPDSSLYIEVPKETDFGFYTCRATNHLGSTSLSFHVQKAGKRGSACAVGMSKSNSTCSDNFQSSEGCSGQHCPHRWHVSSWSTCSVSCGGGLQRRNVTCLGATNGGRSCKGAGRKPTASKSCNMQPCVGWTATPWGPCHGQCVGPQKALQHRHVFCQDKNSTRVTNRMCSRQPRPSSHRNCTTDACALQWRVGPWTQCTATCGRHGFQSRHVTCVHRRSGKPAREFHCAWRPRPASWQRCNILSCGRGDCQDSTRYCEKVRQLELCPLPQFKARCCRSCRDT
ncbi:ADAMTS-like protein 1 isoform X5 [Pangasianodon hypophthalmus]|uniref:ADAMTS-like protein 1 isoform X5 n=1 Tax=Pangasianodon hypophthalmus TaxID=310915 RepID=UPI0023071ECB|nr:ADAMTS-like protein 1 isoform X5 [Pangasianodon hypophthalmus]